MLDVSGERGKDQVSRKEKRHFCFLHSSVVQEIPWENLRGV